MVFAKLSMADNVGGIRSNAIMAMSLAEGGNSAFCPINCACVDHSGAYAPPSSSPYPVLVGRHVFWYVVPYRMCFDWGDERRARLVMSQ